MVTAVFAYLQIALGGVVRVSGSGLGCPDWPLCHGRPYPPADVHAIVEYSHRTVGTITGVLIIATVIGAWLVMRNRRPVVAWLATAALLAVAAEGALGGVVVINELASWLVAIHLGLAMVILGCLIATAVLSMPDSAGVGDARFRNLTLVTTASTFALVLSGSTVVASGADESCHSWPLCGSGLTPDFAGVNAFTMLHRSLVLVIGALIVYTLVAAIRRYGSVRGIVPIGVGTLVVFGLQVIAGAAAAIYDVPLANGLHVALATLLWSGVLMASLLALPRADRMAARSALRIAERPTA